jgi:RNA polymerase sigma-70 factor, ECF subfamily
VQRLLVFFLLRASPRERELSSEQQAASGNSPRTDEFMLLFTRYQRHIYCYIRSLVPRSSDLEEVVQQTNAVLWEKFGNFATGTNFLAWALTVARFEVLNYRARQGRAELLFSNEFLEEIAVKAIANNDLMTAKLEAMAGCRDELSHSDQDLLDRRYTPGATSHSVAKALGRPVVSIYKSLSRIRNRLFDCVERRLSEKEFR